MSGCCEGRCEGPSVRSSDRPILWAALGINASMFLVELAAGLAAGSTALQADALDFLADAANYGISLAVVGLVPVRRAQAALAKGISLGVLGLWIAASAAWHAVAGTVPEPATMGMVGTLALAANAAVALLLFRYRRSDANMRSVWICSRNDVLGNVAVLLAALGVFGTGTGWPDVTVAAVMATLALWGAAQIVRLARAELRGSGRMTAVAAATAPR